MEVSLEDLRKLYRYALVHCEEMCPAVRDPETCFLMFQLGALLGEKPPCADVFGNFTEEVFRRIVSEIEEKYDKPIEEFLREVRSRGPRSLEERSDEIEGSFALAALEVLKRRRGNAQVP